MVDIVTQEEEKTPQAAPSDGVRVFNRALYTGIGFGVNEVSSLWITNQFMLGKNLFEKVPGLKTAGAWFSKEGFEKAGAQLAKTFKFSEKTGADGKPTTSHDRGKNMLLMITLISGGTLLILPMKWLEDSKGYWVKKTDHFLDWMRGSKMNAEEVAARDVEVEQYIACSPRQSWPSMMVGRTIAVLSSIATGSFIVGKRNNDRLMDWSEKVLTGKIQPAHIQDSAHSLRNYARLVSVETYSCALSSVVLEVMSKLFAKRSSKPHDPELCSALSNAAPVAPASSSEDNKATAECAKDAGYCAKIRSQQAMTAGAPLAI